MNAINPAGYGTFNRRTIKCTDLNRLYRLQSPQTDSFDDPLAEEVLFGDGKTEFHPVGKNAFDIIRNSWGSEPKAGQSATPEDSKPAEYQLYTSTISDYRTGSQPAITLESPSSLADQASDHPYLIGQYFSDLQADSRELGFLTRD